MDDNELELNGDFKHEEDSEEEEPEDPGKGSRKPGLVFGITDYPPAHISIFFSLQVVLSVVGGPITISVLISKSVCAEGDNLFLAELISSSLFCVGVATILQVVVGSRLPILQGSSMIYVYIIQAFMQMEEWKCPTDQAITPDLNFTQAVTGSPENYTMPGRIDKSDLWKPRVAMISGGLVIASLFHTALGMFGLVGIFTKFMGPIPVAVFIGLIGPTMHDVIVRTCRQSWMVALFTVAVGVLCGVVLAKFMCPCPVVSRSSGGRRGCHAGSKYPLAKIFANNIALIAGWILCVILTAVDYFPDTREKVGFYARTDAKIDAIYYTKWFHVPYPGQWGNLVQFSLGSLVTAACYFPVLAGTVMESYGDYVGTAAASRVEKPPTHAINRGIMMEGLSSLFGSATGTCHATSSYSSMIGLIALTGVASRFVWILAGAVCIILGVVGKFGAALATVPEPVIGGLLIIAMAMVFTAALNMLDTVDMASARNQIIVGTAFIMGISVPINVHSHPEDIQTGTPEVDQILMAFLGAGPVVGAFIAILMDNILPGSREMRGMKVTTTTTEKTEPEDIDKNDNLYGLPFLPTHKIPSVFRYVPFMPNYAFDSVTCKRPCNKRSNTESQEEQEELATTKMNV